MKFTRLASAVIMCTTSLPILAASYTVAELPTQNVSQNQYAASIDDTGLILTTAQNRFNPPIDLGLINFENDTIISNLTDIESARIGNFNTEDYTYLANRALTGARNSSLFTQQLSEFLAYKTDGTSFDYINGFDTETEALGGFAFSMETTPRDSVAGTHIIGNTVGPFRTIDHTNIDGENVQFVVSDFDQRAFVQVGGNITPLLPIEVTLGGSSTTSRINNNYVVAGTGSFSGSVSLTQGIENCADAEVRGDQPIEACHRSIYSVASGGNIVRRTGLWLQRAHVWSLDVQGNVLGTTAYGTLLTGEDQELLGTSQAIDINNADIAVGVSSVQVDLEDRVVFSTAASIFQNGEVTRILAGDEFLPNSAIGINDEGYIVGVQAQIINQAQRSRMFVYNMNNEEIEFPGGFFASSGTIPRSINNNNLVVGAADIEASSTATRRSAAFIFDIEANTFLNLNSLMTCEDQLEFNLIEAIDINENGEIVATAITKRPGRNVRAEAVQDDSGADVIVDTWVTLKLSPTGAAAQICTDDEDVGLERQGASTGLVLFAMLFGAAMFRRRLFVRT